MEEQPLILFQGDSITDCGRTRGEDASLGNGYPALLAARLGSEHPGQLRFINRGISGNRVPDLLGRWEEDCLSLRPALVSILIGINDVWRNFDAGDATSCEAYYDGYRELLQRTKECGASIVMLEPFVLPVPEDRKAWRTDLDPKIQAARELAREFADAYIPLDGMFAAASIDAPPAYWAQDGVHPTIYGHGLIANAWMHATRHLLP